MYEQIGRSLSQQGRTQIWEYRNQGVTLTFYDQNGFHAYHIAEHHSTPLSSTPSPTVFLAAAARETSRIRLGALLFLLGVDLSLGLGVWAGVTELVPIIGPWVGAVPGLILIAATDLSLLPWVALVYFMVQQLENNFLVPRIQGQALDLHPALIIVLLVVGGAVWGFIGLVTVVPGTAILRELFWYVDRRLRGQSPDEAFAQSRLHNPALDGAPERDLEAIEAAG